MNSLFLSNLSTCYCRPFSRTIRNNGKEVKRVSMLRFRSPRCTMELSIGGESFRYKNIPQFSRRDIRDPYKLLGLTPDASEEEVRSARNFLVNQFSAHEPSVEAIELAYEKILLKSFRERKKAKINFKSKLKNKVDESPTWVRNMLGYLEVPRMEVVLRRAFLFGFLAGWSILNSGETGPAFQRSFLHNLYSTHEPSVESIELAYEKVLLKSFRDRKNAKINFKSRVRNMLGFLEALRMEVVLRRAFLFGFLAGWSILNSGETGPAFQVALSLMACIFFLNDKMKNGWRASLTGIGALVVGWTVGSVMIPLIPSTFFPPTWSLELLTSLIGYFFLFLACVFIK